MNESGVKNIANLINSWHQQGYRVVLATGVFDILHVEHIRFLTKAKSSGDRLIVGIETDKRVALIKGPDRPVNYELVRLEQLLALRVVDEAFVLPEKFDSQPDWVGFINLIRPDVYAVSSHTSYLDNKRQICESHGIEFAIVHQFNPSYSTTSLSTKKSALKDSE